MSRHAKPELEHDETAPEEPVKILGREPALWLATIGVVVQLGSQFIWHFTDTQQGAINAFATLLVGVLTALAVDHEKLAPAIMGALGALLAVGISFGWHLDPTDQSVLMSGAATIIAMFVRTQVTVDLPKHYADDPEPLEAVS